MCALVSWSYLVIIGAPCATRCVAWPSVRFISAYNELGASLVSVPRWFRSSAAPYARTRFKRARHASGEERICVRVSRSENRFGCRRTPGLSAPARVEYARFCRAASETGLLGRPCVCPVTAYACVACVSAPCSPVFQSMVLPFLTRVLYFEREVFRVLFFSW